MRETRLAGRRHSFHDEELARMCHVHELKLERAVGRANTLHEVSHKRLTRVPRQCTSFNARMTAFNRAEKSVLLGHTDWQRSLRSSTEKDSYYPKFCCYTTQPRHSSALVAAGAPSMSTGSFIQAATRRSYAADCSHLKCDVNTSRRTTNRTSRLPSVESAACCASDGVFATLTRLFLPVYRLYIHKKRCKRALSLRKPDAQLPRSRTRDKVVAVGAVLSYLRPLRLPFHGFRRIRSASVTLQRAYRHHRAYLSAHVELNYRNIRSRVEQKYQNDVREENLRHEDECFADELSDKVGGACSYICPRYEPLPELFIRFELFTLYYCWLWRHVESSIGETLPTFLPEKDVYAVLDNVCYITSEMRNDRSLRSHLERRKKMVVPYYGCSIPPM
uniref:Uncharacterized protein n=1 Tax=Trypanosoma congolense (strain IL3000) TaxID=1068625 RepID=G0UW66_TRYCI|nr:conserved hypothetical protein [Trypanosoma congolense IL3000]